MELYKILTGWQKAVIGDNIEPFLALVGRMKREGMSDSEIINSLFE